MTLPALTLNLLDRRLSLAAGMDLLMRRLNEKLDVTNLFITSFQEDYQTASVRYFFGPTRASTRAPCSRFRGRPSTRCSDSASRALCIP